MKAFHSLLLALWCCGAVAAQDSIVVIKAGWIFDPKSGSLNSNVVITVKNSFIVSIDQRLPEGARVINLSDFTIMPGLIDCHTHIVLHPGGYERQILKELPEFRAIYGTRLARITLEAGFTTIRDLGNEGAGMADIALRDAINQGLVPGPRILAAIQPIAATGAYDLVGYSPYMTLPSLSLHADGEDAIRTQVRRLVKWGADVIKVYIESAEKKQSTQDSLTGAVTYTLDELKALVDEAHRADVRVAAHTYSDTGAQLAIAAGVNSIEHGIYIQESTFRQMAAKGIYYVPTLVVYEMWRDGVIFSPVSSGDQRKLAATVRAHTETFKRALRTGVKIALGTDTFELPGTNAREFARWSNTE